MQHRQLSATVPKARLGRGTSEVLEAAPRMLAHLPRGAGGFCCDFPATPVPRDSKG